MMSDKKDIASKKNNIQIQLCALEMIIGFENSMEYCEQQYDNYKQRNKDIVAKIWKERAKQVQKQSRIWMATQDINLYA